MIEHELSSKKVTDTMDTPDFTQGEERSKYIENWYQTEKSAERIAGVALFFIAGLILAFDNQADQWALYAIVAALAGGISLLGISRKPRAARTSLHFLKAKKQNTHAMYAGIGAMILLTQFHSRPLALIVGGVLLVLVAWYQWRASKIAKFDALFKTDQAESDSQGEL